MTRVLADLFGTHNPAFRLGLQQLEQASGGPAHDIRLTAEVQNLTKDKLRELSLDPHDTTGQELYAALGERLRQDERALRTFLRGSTGDGIDDTIEQVATMLKRLPMGAHGFGIKLSVAKKLLKTDSPKRTMKALGYRSCDSMLKHESVAAVFAAAWLLETETWRKHVLAGYGKLKASDFEAREITVVHPVSKRWLEVGASLAAQKRHHILTFRELGAIVLLPLPAERPKLATLTTLVLSLHAMNDLYASASYLRLHQVRSNFGQLVQQVVTGTPTIAAEILNRVIPWSLVQRYYATFGVSSTIFDPHLQLDDIIWQPVESILSALVPSLSFWRQTHHLALLHEGEAVSCNITDALLSHCNALPFEKRISSYFHESLWHELLLRYINQDRLEENIAKSLDLQPVYELELA